MVRKETSIEMRFIFKRKYPDVIDVKNVGKYPLEVFSGGGYFYDDVLEYRVWTKEDGKIVCHSFASYDEAQRFSNKHKLSEKPLVLVRQKEYIDEQDSGTYVHIKRERLTEWQVKWLRGTKGTQVNIPIFLRQHDT